MQHQPLGQIGLCGPHLVAQLKGFRQQRLGRRQIPVGTALAVSTHERDEQIVRALQRIGAADEQIVARQTELLVRQGQRPSDRQMSANVAVGRHLGRARLGLNQKRHFRRGHPPVKFLLQQFQQLDFGRPYVADRRRCTGCLTGTDELQALLQLRAVRCHSRTAQPMPDGRTGDRLTHGRCRRGSRAGFLRSQCLLQQLVGLLLLRS